MGNETVEVPPDLPVYLLVAGSHIFLFTGPLVSAVAVEAMLLLMKTPSLGLYVVTYHELVTACPNIHAKYSDELLQTCMSYIPNARLFVKDQLLEW
jgi:hypothetical protein